MKQTPISLPMKLRPVARLLLALICLASTPHSATAQSSLTEVLVKEGFENVSTFAADDTIYAAFENGHIRGNYRLIGQALKAMAKHAPQAHHYRVLVLENQEPKVQVSARQNNGSWSAKVDYDTRPLRKLFAENNIQAANPTTAKVDVVFHPIVEIDNHSLNVLAYAGVFLAPSFETTLWRGNRIYLQPIFPLFNNFPRGDIDKLPQLGVVGIRQEWIDNKYLSLASTAGTFLYNRVGLQATATAHLSRQLDFGLRATYSHSQQFANNRFDFGKRGKLSLMANVDYYHPQTALQLKLAGGTFLYGDLGLRTDIIRHFGEHTVGLYGIYTGGEWNAGFNFSFPLMPRKLYNREWVRTRIPQYFSWEYSLMSWPKEKYVSQNMGQDIKERPDKSNSAHYWQAAYLQHYLVKWLNGVID